LKVVRRETGACRNRNFGTLRKRVEREREIADMMKKKKKNKGVKL